MIRGDCPAGPGALRYRIGTYDSFLAGMQNDARCKAPLASLNFQIEGDFTNALISGWARVCDVLTFYQERIANEGYLPTAVEPASIVWLAAEIGERGKPAVGAQASLAVRLIDAPGQPESLIVEAGPSLAVQNAPTSPDALPVVFECAERRELRPAWNALAPVVAPILAPAAVWPGCRSLRLVGTSLGIRPGGALLLSADDGQTWLAIADTVQVDRVLGCTLVTWRDLVEGSGAIVAVTQFQRSAGLFGRTAMDWADVPDKQKQAIGVRAGGVMTLDQSGLTPDPGTPGPDLWARPPGAAPPPANIQALLGIGGDALLAGTDRGVFRSNDRGATWQTLTLPQPKGWHDVLSLHQDASGTLYAGTAAGVVLVSGDGGDGWAMMTQTVTPAGSPNQSWFFNTWVSRARGLTLPGNWTLQNPIRAIATNPNAGAAPDIYIGTDEGAFVMPGGAADWQPFSDALPGYGAYGTASISVVALALVDAKTTNAALLAATDRGFYLYTLSNSAWALITAGAPDPCLCTSLASDGSAGNFVGTSVGVFHIHGLSGLEDFNKGFSPPPAIVSLAFNDDVVCGATADGLYASPKNSAAWVPLEQDLTLFEIDGTFADALVPGPVPPALSQRFERFGIDLAAGAGVQPLYLPPPADHVAPPLPIGPVMAWELAETDPPGRIFRIYLETPLRVTQRIGNRPGEGGRIAVLGDGTLVASVPLGPVLNEEWPDFAIGTGAITGDAGVDGAEIYLDRRIDGIEDDSRLVLAPLGCSLIPEPEVHAVAANETILHKAYGKQGIVTRIVVAEPTAALLAVDLRAANAYLIDRPLAPFTATNANLEPLAGTRLRLPGVHGSLAPGRSLQVSGPRPAAVIVERAQTSQIVLRDVPLARAGADAAPALDQQMISPELRAAFTAAGVKLSPNASVMVLDAGETWLVRDGDQVWRLRLPAGSAESLPLRIHATTLYEAIARPKSPDQPWILQCGDEMLRIWGGHVPWQRAASTQRSSSEIVTIETVMIDPEADVTIVTLTAPLEALYDSALCRICANVVLATQGETVTGEVLGSGQPSLAGQRFTLHRSPLTFTHDWIGYGVHSDLEVRVNGESGRALRFGEGMAPVAPPGERWTEIRALALAGPSQRVFALGVDDVGRATLHFGNGVHGARLPSGSNNVIASYRAGAGARGNVPAGSLIALRKRPPGIRSVTNPVAAAGGEDAESTEALRLRAPRKLHCCDRIVTLDDYEAFVRELTGVGHVQAALLGDMIWLTLATSQGRPISQLPELEAAIRTAIAARRADQLELRLEDPKVVPFDVVLHVDIEPRVHAATALRLVTAVLARTFGPGARGFGRSVDPGEVVAAAGAVPGVEAVQLVGLCRTGEQPGVATLVPAPARIDLVTGKVEPAEWLVLDANAGIIVSVRNG